MTVQVTSRWLSQYMAEVDEEGQHPHLKQLSHFMTELEIRYGNYLNRNSPTDFASKSVHVIGTFPSIYIWG